MKVIVLYKEQTDYARDVNMFLHDFEHQTGHALETMDPESAEGIQFCGTYDIMDFPSIIALSDGGELQNYWRGLPLPTISELSFYIQ